MKAHVAYVFLRIPEDSHLRAEKPRTIALHAVGSKPAASQAWHPDSRSPPQPAGRVGTARGQPNGPSSPSAARPRSASDSWNLPDPGCLQHFRRGAEPLLHSRKIFVQGLGTRRRGNKSHLGAGRAVLPCCFVALSAPPDCLCRPRAHRLGPEPTTPPHTLAALGVGPGCQLFAPSAQESFVCSGCKRLWSWLWPAHHQARCAVGDQALSHSQGCCEVAREADHQKGR